jgi:hypothetical protein
VSSKVATTILCALLALNLIVMDLIWPLALPRARPASGRFSLKRIRTSFARCERSSRNAGERGRGDGLLLILIGRRPGRERA